MLSFTLSFQSTTVFSFVQQLCALTNILRTLWFSQLPAAWISAFIGTLRKILVCLPTLQPLSQYTHFHCHLALPLSYTRLHLGLRCPDSCLVRGVGWGIGAKCCPNRNFQRHTSNWGLCEFPVVSMHYGPSHLSIKARNLCLSVCLCVFLKYLRIRIRLTWEFQHGCCVFQGCATSDLFGLQWYC